MGLYCPVRSPNRDPAPKRELLSQCQKWWDALELILPKLCPLSAGRRLWRQLKAPRTWPKWDTVLPLPRAPDWGVRRRERPDLCSSWPEASWFRSTCPSMLAGWLWKMFSCSLCLSLLSLCTRTHTHTPPPVFLEHRAPQAGHSTYLLASHANLLLLCDGWCTSEVIVSLVVWLEPWDFHAKYSNKVCALWGKKKKKKKSRQKT